MLDKVLKVLEDILIDIKYQNSIRLNFKEDCELSDLKKQVDNLILKVFSQDTKLLLVKQLLEDFFKTDPPLSMKNFYVHESRNLLEKHNLSNLIIDSWKKKFDELPPYEQPSAESYSYDYHPTISKVNEYQTILNECSNCKEIQYNFMKIFNRYCEDIDMIVYDGYYIKIDDYDREEYFNLFQQEESNYIKWTTDKITLKDWKKFPDTSFLSFIDINCTSADYEMAISNQKRLYHEALELELSSLVRNIKELNTVSQKNVIGLHFQLIKKFFLGEYTHLDYERLSNVVKFDRPEKVIIEYDDIMRFETYNYSKLLPYDGEYSKKSPRFSADLLLKYENFLIEQLNRIENPQSPITIDTEEKQTKPIPYNFGFNRPDKKKKLELVIETLQLKYSLIDESENDISDLLEILFAYDYTSLNISIKIGCNTNLFSYCISQIRFLFDNLKPDTIEASKLFITKSISTTPVILTKTNFNKSSSKLSQKKKEEIDKIVIELKK